MAGKLRPREQRFCDEYSVIPDSKLAATRAGYKSPYSGAALLSRAHIQAELDKRARARAARYEGSAERVLEELARIAFARVGDYVDQDGRGANIGDIPADAQAAVVALDTRTEADGTVTTRLKLADKLRALELLGRAYGVLRERVEHSVTVTGGLVHVSAEDVAKLDDARLRELHAVASSARRLLAGDAGVVDGVVIDDAGGDARS